ncbi:recombinase family protein [Streptomyces sp. NBC_00371]
MSFRKIAAILDAEELRPKHGGRWHPETVHRMLANATDLPPSLRKRSSR